MRTRNRFIATATLLALAGSVLVAGVAPAVATNHPTVRFVTDPTDSEDTDTGDDEAEGDSGTSTITFHLQREGGDQSQPLDVNVFTSDGTAVGGDDYDTKNTTINFNAEEEFASVDVTIHGDGTPERNETFTMNIGAPTSESDDYAVDGEADVAVGTILNDDGPELTVDSPSGSEGAPGTSTSVTVTITADWTGIDAGDRIPASVSFQTLVDESDGANAATLDEDFEDSSGRVTINPPAEEGTNTSEHPFVVTILGDDLYEGGPQDGGGTPETFLAALIDPEFATFPTPSDPPEATVSIEDDEEPPTVTVDDTKIIEGDEGTTLGEVTVHLSHPSIFETTVRYSTGDGTATNIGNDYVPIPSGTELVIDPERTFARIEVEVKGDTTKEPNEDFKVNISLHPDSEEHANLPEGEEGELSSITGTVEVLNDDGPYLSFEKVAGQAADLGPLTDGDLALPEGQDGDITEFTFTVVLSETVDQEVTVDFATADGTATAAQNDYEATNGTLTIPAGQTSGEAVVNVIGDDFPGPSEWFFLNLTTVAPSPDVTILDDQARGTLVSDDGPAISVDDVEMVEGDPDGDDTTTEVELTLSIPEPYTPPEEDDPAVIDCGFDISCDVTVNWRTLDGTATEKDDDYLEDFGTLTIPEGETSATITVTVNRDTKPEADETFAVRLTEPSFAKLDADASAFRDVTIAILNDEGPILTIDDVDVAEGDDGTADAVFTISLPEDATNPVQVDFATKDGTATVADNDYIARSGTVKFEPTQRTRTVTVKVIGDLRFEDDETFHLALSKPQFARLGSDKQGTATVPNDDDNQAPVADAGADLTAVAGQPVTFDGSASHDPDGHALDGYAWTFGDGGTGTGAEPTHTYGQAGTYTAELTVTDPEGATDADTVTVTVGAGAVSRSAGEDRIATAVAVSADHWDAATDVVLATARNFPDALAGGALAAKLDAPLLLTDAGALPSAVAGELSRLGAQRAWLLGGPAAIGPGVEQALKDAGLETRRVAGFDRFETAAAVAAEVGAAPTSEVALTLGIHEVETRAWPDALSAGSLAAAADRLPTLLTRGDQLPAVTEQALGDLGTKKVLLIGGTAAIGEAVEARLVDLGYEVERRAGADRYATSVAVATDALGRAGTGDVPVVFATGANYPDGLAAAALAARLEGLVLLVPGTADSLHADVEGFLTANRDRLAGGVVVGGTAVVTDAIRTQLSNAMTG